MIIENIKQEHILAGAIVLITAVIIFLLLRRLFVYNNKRKIRNIIKKISYDFIEDIEIDEGLEHYAHLDYICLGQDGIHIIAVKNYAGHIFAADDINEWSQIVDRKSYKFPNPGFELTHSVELLKTMTDLDVTGYNIFSDTADFPKGRPESVILCADMLEFFGKVSKRNLSDSLLNEWKKLKLHLCT